MNAKALNIAPDDEHNRRLIENVHPAGWENPTPKPRYNLAVIGAGTAGLISAIATATLGGTVALIERHLMGGDCLNVGCVPSKSLIRPSRLAAEMKNAALWGLPEAAVGKDAFPIVMERLRRIRAHISKNDSAARYKELGVDVFLGDGRFTGPDCLAVNGKNLFFKKAVIATGARAARPDIPGLHAAGFLTNETVFNLTKLPEHLVVVGAGPIGCELAQAFRRLGSRVSIVQHSGFLPHEDPEAAGLLAGIFAEEGIELYLQAKTISAGLIENGRKRLTIEHEGAKKEISGDEILIGAGRVPNIEGLGLEAAGVRHDSRKGVLVDDFLRTSNCKIFAAGDCCMAWKFTHAADAAAQIAVRNALFLGRRRLSRLIMPWCTYTDPEIAHVGLYEREARKQGRAVQSFRFDLADNDRSLTDGEVRGFVKIMVEKGGSKILGATIVAAHAGEMISEITAAMHAGMGLGSLASVIHPYPTQAEAIKRAAGLYIKSRLTPFVARLLKAFLKWQR